VTSVDNQFSLGLNQLGIIFYLREGVGHFQFSELSELHLVVCSTAELPLDGAGNTMSALGLAVTSTLQKLGNQGPCCCDDNDGSQPREVGTVVTPVSQMRKPRH
jgi:hypothetical protein